MRSDADVGARYDSVVQDALDPLAYETFRCVAMLESEVIRLLRVGADSSKVSRELTEVAATGVTAPADALIGSRVMSIAAYAAYRRGAHRDARELVLEALDQEGHGEPQGLERCTYIRRHALVDNILQIAAVTEDEDGAIAALDTSLRYSTGVIDQLWGRDVSLERREKWVVDVLLARFVRRVRDHERGRPDIPPAIFDVWSGLVRSEVGPVHAEIAGWLRRRAGSARAGLPVIATSSAGTPSGRKQP